MLELQKKHGFSFIDFLPEKANKCVSGPYLESASEAVEKILAVLRRLVGFEAKLLEETAAAVEGQLSWGLEE